MWCSLLLSPPAALAHNLDCQGRPIPANIKTGCCGPGDVLQLTADRVRGDDDSGWEVLIDGDWRQVIHKEWLPTGGLSKGEKVKALPSDDGCTWVWYRRRGSNGFMEDRVGDGEFNFYCLQIPMTM
jgi:hypothetical protein